MAYIYKITNLLNGKAYVGFSTDPGRRAYFHQYLAAHGSEQAIHRAIRKYGWKNFDFKIVYIGEDAKHTLNVMEPHFIALYETFGPKGYNLTIGGEGALGLVISEESKRKMSLNHANFKGKNHPNFGRQWSPEIRNRMSAGRKGKAAGACHPKAKRYTVTFPDNHTEQTNDLPQFCRLHSLVYSSVKWNLQNHSGQMMNCGFSFLVTK